MLNINTGSSSVISGTGLVDSDVSIVTSPSEEHKSSTRCRFLLCIQIVQALGERAGEGRRRGGEKKYKNLCFIVYAMLIYIPFLKFSPPLPCTFQHLTRKHADRSPYSTQVEIVTSLHSQHLQQTPDDFLWCPLWAFQSTHLLGFVAKQQPCGFR